MSLFKRILRTVLRPVVTISDLDIRIVRWRLPTLGARHAEPSVIISLDDSPGAPSPQLIELIPRLIARAQHLRLPLLVERNAPELVHLWPGEHYRLLAAIVQELRPVQVVEIGTYTGLSALAMLSSLPEDSQLTTVDVIPWDKIPGTFLKESDFASGRLRQLVCDFASLEVCKQYALLLQQATLFFIDAPKDGRFERRLLENFTSIGLKNDALLVFDDIRILNMLRIWRDIRRPKLDLTSFGHWMGTGLVQWGERAEGFRGPESDPTEPIIP